MHPPSPPYRTPKVPSARVSYRCCPRSFSRRGPSLRSRCFSCRGLPRAHAQPVYYTGVALVLFLVAALLCALVVFLVAAFLALTLSPCIIPVLPSFFFSSRPFSALSLFFLSRPSSRSRSARVLYRCCPRSFSYRGPPRALAQLVYYSCVAFVLFLVAALLCAFVLFLSASLLALSLFFLLRLSSHLRSLSCRGPPRDLDLYLIAALCVLDLHLVLFLVATLLAPSFIVSSWPSSRSRSLSCRGFLRSHCFSRSGPPRALDLSLVADLLALSISILPAHFAFSLFFFSWPSSRPRSFSCRCLSRSFVCCLVVALLSILDLCLAAALLCALVVFFVAALLPLSFLFLSWFSSRSRSLACSSSFRALVLFLVAAPSRSRSLSRRGSCFKSGEIRPLSFVLLKCSCVRSVTLSYRNAVCLNACVTCHFVCIRD